MAIKKNSKKTNTVKKNKTAEKKNTTHKNKTAYINVKQKYEIN